MMESSFPGPPRLLIPTVRSPVPPPLPQSPPSPPTRRQTSSKLIRSRSGSATASLQSAAFNAGTTGASQYYIGELWIGRKSRFQIDEDRIELQGYQMYAVEKWIVERVRPVTVLTVYTGDPAHKITVTVLKPAGHLTSQEADAELKLCVQHLRKDGARPKQTPLGILMVTSLANFRSDYTIVQIPNGDFLAAQGRLYCNINLLRMGCSGRSAVTLEEPSETTKDRFKSLFFIPDAPSITHPFRSKSPTHSRVQTRTFSHSPSPLIIPDTLSSSSNMHPMHGASNINAQQSQRHPHFAATVLELVKLIQSALSVCGMFPLTSRPIFDGLLCDVTIDGLQKWMAEVGESLPGVEATERILDPTAVAALLSFVLSARNKLASLAQAVPKDPFLHPHALIAGISAYTQAQLVCVTSHPNNGTHSTALLVPTATPMSATVSGRSSPGPGPSISPTISSYSHSPSIGAGGTAIQPTTPTYLNLSLYTALMSTHETKIKHSDSRRVQRIILSTLDAASETDTSDEERRGLSGRVRGFVGRGCVAGAGGILAPMADLGTFVRALVGRDKLHDRVGTRAEKNKSERERHRKDEKPDELDEKERVAGSVRALWTGRVEIAVRMRARAAGPTPLRTQVKEREKDQERLTSSDVDDSGVVKSAGEDDIDLTFGGAWSGKVQKKLEFWAGINRSKRSIDLSSPLRSTGRSSLTAVPLSTQSSLSGHVECHLSYGKIYVHLRGRDEEGLLSSGQASPISISRTNNSFILDPSTDASYNLAQGSTSNLNKDDPEYDRRVKSFLARQPRRNRDESRVSSWSGVGSLEDQRKSAHKSTERECEAESKRRMLRHDIQSFHDLDSFRDFRILRPEWMRIDVDLCGQLLVMRRREELLRGMIGCAEHICSSLAATNEALQQDHKSHHEFLSNLSSHPEILQRVEDARAAAYASRQQVAALEYEAGQFRRQDLWRAAIAPRAKVLELRSKVFGSDTIGSRKRRRMEWTLGGEEREVDAWGRTESEAEEEHRAGAGLGDLRVLREDTEDEMSEAEEEEHEAILMQPMWLLKFLTSWTARLGFLAGQGGVQAQSSQPNQQSREHSTTSTPIVKGASISPSSLS
ncbi:hypothetical protein AZE42_00374 [Rhizopogon vesiculosus]|uniref:STB6-like N-terminal domain-containing protein n=1 Tax=Rhizopogon vesiculosus TaxID=180088 RepID=A0A1J8RB66_9AGAM|nr:hypothetical protein AZE42_00374 [Rhizopogon vesiculosus]